MRTIYTATQRSVLEYASPAWYPWTSRMTRERMERVQTAAARAISGVVRSMTADVVGAQRGGAGDTGGKSGRGFFGPIQEMVGPGAGDVRRHLVERGVPQRTRKEGWRTVCEGLRSSIPDLQALEHEDGEEDDRTRLPSWREALPFDFHYTEMAKAEPPDVQRQRTEACLEEMGPADLHLFTDGGTERGGGGVVVFDRGGGGVVVFDRGGEVERLSLPAGIYCSSFTAEVAALLVAGGERGMDHCCPDNGQYVPAPSPPGARGRMQSGGHPKRAMGPLWQRQAGRAYVCPRPLWTSRE